MTPHVIRAKLRQRPFRPLDFVLDNGEAIRITSPEIFVAEDMVATVDRRGRAVIISPQAITMIRPANGARGSSRTAG